MNQDFTDYGSEHHFNPVPCLFTLCNALCGFTSILYALNAEDGRVPAASLWLVCGAMLFDVLDGLVARMLKAQSIHGMNLDSMADVISFGVAPAVMIHRLILNNNALSEMINGIAWLVAAFYLGCALWRLAHYNTLALQDADDHGDFLGLPSPGAAALICSMAVLIPEMDLGSKTTTAIFIIYTFLSAGLMVSAVPYTHVKRCLATSRKWVTFLVLSSVIASIILFKVWALVAWAHLYALHAPLIALEARVKNREENIRPASV